MIDWDSIKRVDVYWMEAPPARFLPVTDSHRRDPAAELNCVLWRNRWCLMDDEWMDNLGVLELRLRGGLVGLGWVKW